MKKILIVIMMLLPIICYGGFATSVVYNCGTSDSIGVDADGDGSVDYWLYPAIFKKGDNVTFSVNGDTLTITCTGGGGGSVDTIYIHDGSTYYDNIANQLRIKEGAGLDIQREDSTDYDVIRLVVSLGTNIEDGEVDNDITVDEASDVDTSGTKINAALGDRILDGIVDLFKYFSRDYFDTTLAGNDSITVIYSDSSDISIFDTDDLTEGSTNLYNQTHTGDVTGSVALTISSDAVETTMVDDTQFKEYIDDNVGGMVTGNTETRITVTYQDGDGTIDFVVDDMNDDVPESGDFGNAADLEADGSLSTGCVADNEIDYSNVTLTDFDYQTPWRTFYSNTDGDVVELAFGTDGQYLKSNGASSAPSWDTPSGAGDMLKSTYDVAINGIVDDVDIDGTQISTALGAKADTSDLMPAETLATYQVKVDSGAGWLDTLPEFHLAEGSKITFDLVACTLTISASAGGGGDDAKVDTGAVHDLSTPFVIQEKNGIMIHVDNQTVDTMEIEIDTANAVSDGEVKTVTGNAVYDYCVSNYQPLEATLTDIADGTIAENLVNTANPWADNEIASSSNWNTAYGWGNHAGLYPTLTQFGYVTDDTTNYQTAYGWGDHSTQNYLDDDVADDVDDGDIDWGTGAGQVSPTDFANEDIGDITITTGSWAVKDDSHNHVIANVDGLAAGLRDSATVVWNDSSGIIRAEMRDSAAVEIGDSLDALRAEIKSRSFVILDTVKATFDFPFWQTPDSIVITAVSAVCTGGTNVVGALQEYNATGTAVDNAVDGDWTITTSEFTDESFTDPNINPGDWLGWKTESVSGDVSAFSITFEYYIAK